MKILVVDDEPSVRALLKALFVSKQYEVAMAESGPHALECLRAGDVDLMLTDMRMSPMDGIELLKSVRQIHPHLPVVFLSAHATPAAAAGARELGAFDYIIKPFRVEELLETVQRAIDAARPAAAKPG